MKPVSRYLEPAIRNDLAEKMVFIGGPRQVGKTTLALAFLDRADPNHPAYLNWDNIHHRSALLRGELPPHQRIVVFDEIHKYLRWRNLIKGLYDTHRSVVSFLITGSARLDYYRRGGDSLQGRYHYHRLHPFSLPEISSAPSRGDLAELMRFGGFPEPFLKADERFLRRWQKERLTRVVYDDIRDLENVKEISLLELLVEELPSRVGSPLSIKNLRETLQVAHDTVERWISILERLYVCFRIPPYGAPRIRAVKKEKKLYLFDWSAVADVGARFENLVACQLLKFCHAREDSEGYSMELRYLRDTDRREVDFVVTQDRKPLYCIECKTGDRDINPHLRYFRQRTEIPRCYQVHLGDKDFGHAETDVRMLPFRTFCSELGMP